MDKRQEELLTYAKLQMLRQMPYYGTFVIGTPIVEDSKIPTAATDYTQIRINTDWLLRDGRPREEVIFVLAHEVLHMALKHGIRMGFRHSVLWNVACDYAINWILHEGKVGKMPEPDPKKKEVKLLDQKYANMAAEAIYDLLEKQWKKQGGGQKLKMGGITIDLSNPDPGGTGSFESPINIDGSALTPSQRSELERQIDAKNSASAAAAKSVGKLPAGLEFLIQTALKPQVDWRERLRMFVAKQFPSDYSWARPHRRYLPHDLYLPHVQKQGVGHILAIMDTSGSVGYDGPKSEGAQYFSEIKAISEDVMPEKLHVMYCDADVAGHDEFSQGEEPKLNPRGRGGTDFRPPFVKVAKEGIDIQCAIYLTDGYGPFPETPPSYPVLWVITTDVVPPFGEHIKINVHA